MVSKNNINKKRGFTIIEVVLVLAIAGLIFLMVFIAFPALQRAQRNTQRRDDYSMLVAAVNSYMSSNNGKLSNLLKSGGGDGVSSVLSGARWINGTGLDPSGNPYELVAYSIDKWDNNTKPKDTLGTQIGICTVKVDGDAKEETCKKAGGDWQLFEAGESGSQVFIVIGANCNGVDNNGDPRPTADGAKRAFAVYGYIEGGGYFCQDSGAIGNKTETEATE